MQVKEVMTKDVECVQASETLQTAARKMAARDVGILPVHDADLAVGVITDRDITVRGVANGQDPTKTAVRDVMTRDVLHVDEDQDVQAVAKLMEEKKVRRAIVLGAGKTISGIVSLGDLAVRVRGRQQDLSGEVLERVCEPGQTR